MKKGLILWILLLPLLGAALWIYLVRVYPYGNIPEKIAETIKSNPQGKKYMEYINLWDEQKDTIKRNSLYFLLEHMGKHSSVVKDAGGMGYHLMPDTEYVNPEDLIKHIELTCSLAERSLRSGELDFEIFKEFILPYRLANEEFIPWNDQARSIIKEGLDIDYPHSFQRDSLLDVVSLVNDFMGEGFKFSFNEVPASLLTWDKLMNLRTGDCYHMTHVVTYPLRALGIPISIDFITQWGNTNGGGHAWNTVIFSERDFIPFMGCESNPPHHDPLLIHKEKRLPAKIFRKIYSYNPANLSSIKSEKESIPVFLTMENFIDVTDLYIPAKDIAIFLDSLGTDILRSYISVYSNSKWVPVYWGVQDGQEKVLFEKMATNMLYIVGIYENNQFLPLLLPFLHDEDGQMRTLKPNPSLKQRVELKYLNSKALEEQKVIGGIKDLQVYNKVMDEIYQNTYGTRPKVGESYSLFIYESGWKKIKETAYRSGLLTFEDVATNALYLVVQSDKKIQNERPFTVNNGEIRWW